MCRYSNHNNSPFVKIVYAKEVINGKLELISLELYADGSIKRNQ
jgi:hypothetical protein